VVYEGAAHTSFMSGTPSKDIQANDLSATMSEKDGYVAFAHTMARWVKSVVVDGWFEMEEDSIKTMDIFLEAMYQEGAYFAKPPCNNNAEINPDDPTCLKGSAWIQDTAVNMFAGKLADKHVTLVDSDNFHPASETIHYHHPDLSSDCVTDANKSCTVSHISITENIYDKLKEDKIAKTPIAATEMRAKIKSIQSIHQAAGETTADFTTLDLGGNECQLLLNASISWAESKASKTALKAYKDVGQAMQTDVDIPYTNGGLWIVAALKTSEDSGKSYIKYQSKSLPLDHT